MPCAELGALGPISLPASKLKPGEPKHGKQEGGAKLKCWEISIKAEREGGKKGIRAGACLGTAGAKKQFC